MGSVYTDKLQHCIRHCNDNLHSLKHWANVSILPVYISGIYVKGIVHVYLKAGQRSACVARLNKHKLDK